MNDNELADKVVALGVGRLCPDRGFQFRTEDLSGVPQEFVRDWRVAGALMEECARTDYLQITSDRKCRSQDVFRAWIHNATDERVSHARGDSYPRAVIEACVEALS